MGAVNPRDGNRESGSRTIVLDVHGALDMVGAPALCREIDAAATEGQRIVVDLTGVTVGDSSGVRALVGAAREATVRLRILVVTVTANSALDRLITRTGAREFLRLADSDATPSAAGHRRAVTLGS